jgi:methionyl-tRNA formyltransferase
LYVLYFIWLILKKGKGWSPLTWQILEVAEEVDSGPIISSGTDFIRRSDLVDELRREQVRVTINLWVSFVKEYLYVIERTKPQTGIPTNYSRRFLKYSNIDLDLSLREQTNQFRVANNQRFPVWFKIEENRFFRLFKGTN